jgi:hypothetical protein
MRLDFFIGPRALGDARITLFRLTSGRWIYGEGWKVSVSLHRKLFYWKRQYKEIRATLLGVNVHWRWA